MTILAIRHRVFAADLAATIPDGGKGDLAVTHKPAMIFHHSPIGGGIELPCKYVLCSTKQHHSPVSLALISHRQKKKSRKRKTTD